jgi:hypothetical protein
MVSGVGQMSPLFDGFIDMLNVLVFVPVFALQLLQLPQFPEQSTLQLFLVHDCEIIGSSQDLPPYISGIVINNFLSILPEA